MVDMADAIQGQITTIDFQGQIKAVSILVCYLMCVAANYLLLPIWFFGWLWLVNMKI